MAVIISGFLIDGAGVPMSGYDIILRAQANSSKVVVHSVSTTTTGQDGEYTIHAQPGRYSVEIKEKWKPAIPVGNIAIYTDSPSGTLNDFLLKFGPDDLTPDVVKRFEALAAAAQLASDNAKNYAELASNSAQSTNEAMEAVAVMHGDVRQWHSDVSTSSESVSQSLEQVQALSNAAHLSAEAAKGSENQALDAQHSVNKAAQGVNDHAISVAEKAQHIEELANNTAQLHEDVAKNTQVAIDAATSAAQSAVDAGEHNTSSQGAAERAERAAAEAEHKIAGAMQAENALSEIASLGAPAQAKAQKNLGLGTAATQRVQTSKYDKVREAVAVAGSFGFGGYLENKDVITFTEQNTLLGWIKHAYPGRYLISQSGIQIVPGLNLNYVTLEVIQSYLYKNSPTDKILRLYSHSEVYTCAFSSYTGVGSSSDPGRLSNWKKTSPESLLDVLRSASGVWGDPGVGGLILAAYQGKAAGDKNIQLARGQAVSGSRLGQVGIEAGFGGSTFVSDARAYVANCTSYPLPGAYMALSGIPTATGDRAWIGLFMRYA
ncbi:MAG: prophage tail fiber N-terminal domain-containing protein [Plesiomonas sp.]|uniref:prophage tail fiber N-terminal domain-containing protein n=1 Tax=Plesiomonas sp. TaxID=2486279 RepID=UPI003F3752C8